MNNCLSVGLFTERLFHKKKKIKDEQTSYPSAFLDVSPNGIYHINQLDNVNILCDHANKDAVSFICFCWKLRAWAERSQW